MSRQVQQNPKPTLTPLKNIYFQRPFFDALVTHLGAAWAGFDPQQFFDRLYAEGWNELELKGRMRRGSEALAEALPADYTQAVKLLLQVESFFDGFDHMLFADFVELQGLDEVEASLTALERFTRSSSEFAIRPFILRYPERTMARMTRWATNPDVNLRRLASEGCRPRLPWAMALPAFKRDPSPILPILEILRTDPSEYVRRSVANNLNDISKDHPERVINLAKRWLKEAPETKPLLRHALRTLLKAGDQRALALFGWHEGQGITIQELALTPAKVKIGNRATLSFSLHNTGKRTSPLRLEYRIDYYRPRGKSGRKIFQVGAFALEPGETKSFSRQLDFTPRTTRQLYPGPHHVCLILNGKCSDLLPIELLP